MLLVDDAHGEPGELHVLLDQGVGPDDQAELARGEPGQRPPRGRRVEPVRSVNGIVESASSRSSVWALLASVSVGAIRAA